MPLSTLPRLALGAPCAILLGLALFGGCAGAQEAGDAADSTRAAPREAPSSEQSRLDLARTSPEIRTVQLYRGTDERALPILELRPGRPQNPEETLSLEFDLMSRTSRPLSVYFYHADRTWRRDLTPVEYLDSFESDNLIDYEPARGADVPYVHYTYRFPNDDIAFRLSGNYVLRVTERGREDEVLFEQPFFVTEQAGPLEVGVDGIVVSGQSSPSDRLIAQFTPPGSLQGNVFDYDVCFAQGGQLTAPRCTDQARLAQQPQLRFEMDQRAAYAPAAADYVLDLGNLRGGPQIEGADFTAVPPRIILDPDYANFAGSSADPLLAGQVVVAEAVTDRADPDVAAEYVTVQFSFVPEGERPFDHPVYLTGSFGGAAEAAPVTGAEEGRLRWSAERRRYEGDLLLKQGLYEYHYTSPDAATRRQLQRALPRLDSRYAAFVYYSDVSARTDRLLAVTQVQKR